MLFNLGANIDDLVKKWVLSIKKKSKDPKYLDLVPFICTVTRYWNTNQKQWF